MTEEEKQALKEEAEDDLHGPISALNRKFSKKKEPISKDSFDDDDVPLAFSKAKKKKPSNSPNMKKEEPEDDEDEMPLKKMESLKKRPFNSPKVGKEEPEDDEDEKPLRKKKEVLKQISKPKIVKKEVLVDSEEEEENNKSKKRKRKEEKMTVVKVKKVGTSQQKVKNDKKEKKVYELPGQKHDPPEMRDPLRIFYETLYEKVPTSEMAAIWLMEWGLLSLEEAQKVYAKKLRKNHNQKFSSPAKLSTTPVKKSSTISVKKEVKVTSKTAVKTTKKKVIDSDDDEDDDDFVLEKLSNKKKVSS